VVAQRPVVLASLLVGTLREARVGARDLRFDQQLALGEAPHQLVHGAGRLFGPIERHQRARALEVGVGRQTMARSLHQEAVERRHRALVLVRLPLGDAQIEQRLVLERALGKVAREVLEQVDGLARVIDSEQRLAPQQVGVVHQLVVGILRQQLLRVGDRLVEVLRARRLRLLDDVGLAFGRLDVVLPRQVEGVVVSARGRRQPEHQRETDEARAPAFPPRHWSLSCGTFTDSLLRPKRRKP